jgi:uncharacterized protein YkwD
MMHNRAKKTGQAFSFENNRKDRASAGGVAAAVVVVIGVIAALMIVNYAFPSFFSFLTPEREGVIVYNITPIDGQIIMASPASISASYSDDLGTINSVTILVDGANVTGSAMVNSSGVEYDANLGAGTHTVVLTLKDSSGNSVTKKWSFSVNFDVQNAVLGALNEINTAREALGIANVSLVEPIASTFRGEDMLNNLYFGHYDLNGYQPEYYYTKLGGLYTMEENIAYDYLPSGTEGNLTGIVVNFVHSMIYDDVFSLFDHRDSILDPTNNYVDIAIVNDSNRVFIVVHMIKDWIDWQSPPTFVNGTFSCAGMLKLSGSSLENIDIYYSDPSAHDSYQFNPQLNISTGETSYNIGDPVAGVQPDPQQTYINIVTIRPQTWISNGQYFDVSFPFSATNGTGIYTITIWVNNTLPTKSPYDVSRYEYSLPALEYTVELP